MKNNNNDLKHEEINLRAYKSIYFLIGFIVGIIPYIILLASFESFTTLNQLSQFKEILVTIGICTAFINAFILQSKINKKCAEILALNKGVKINS
ncbi:MAG: hypothetical protein K2G03_00445 [Bacilli bacterium]|nr:hypothetical protein [Bacilli bacterium]MDE6141047.1 hypothetical protein [Bacilli bacterium]